MPLKIRLTRQGRKRKPFYHIVIADSRAPRDGKYIERIGLYNSVTNPATIEMNFDRALYWVQQGAQPTDTCRTLLSANGVMYKKHLLEGVKKGAFSEEEAEKRFDSWKKEKEAKLHAIRSKLKKAKDAEEKKRIETEVKINEAKAEEIARKNAELAEAEAKAARKTSVEVVEETAEETTVQADNESSAEIVEEKVEKAEAPDIANKAETEDIQEAISESSEEPSESEPQDVQKPKSEESEKGTEEK